MLRIALTHDVDRVQKTFQYLTYPIKRIIKGDYKGFFYQLSSIFKKNPYWCFNEIINVENNYDVKSTIFFLNESIPIKLLNISNWKYSLGRYKVDNYEVSKMIKYFDQNGWEIGLHGSCNSFRDKELLRSEKKLLESITGGNIIGIRQHYLHLNETTWNIQKELGFKYDTSFGFSNNIGYKDNIFKPFHPFSDNFTVFPMVIMDESFMNTADRIKKLLYLLDITEKNNSILVVNWHQRSFNENEFPGYKKAYCDIIEECKKRNAIFKTLKDYYLER